MNTNITHSWLVTQHGGSPDDDGSGMPTPPETPSIPDCPPPLPSPQEPEELPDAA